jgi:hypothetical protein
MASVSAVSAQKPACAATLRPETAAFNSQTAGTQGSAQQYSASFPQFNATCSASAQAPGFNVVSGFNKMVEAGSRSARSFSSGMHRYLDRLSSGQRLQPAEMLKFMMEMQTHSVGMDLNIHVAGKSTDAVKQLMNGQ